MLSHDDLLKQLNILRTNGDIYTAEHLLCEWTGGYEGVRNQWHAFTILYEMSLVEGLLDKCCKYAQALVNLDPQDAYAHHCLGTSNYLGKEYCKAECSYRSAVDIAKDSNDPNYYSYVIDLGWVVFEQEKYIECEYILNTISLDADDTSASNLGIFAEFLYLSSTLYQKTNRNEEAITYLHTLIRLISRSDMLFFRPINLIQKMIDLS